MSVAKVLSQCWAVLEGSFDTPLAFAAADAVDLVEFSIEPFENANPTQSHTGTASLQDEVIEDKGGTWSASAYIRPNALTVPPDIGPALLAAALVETIGADVQYTLEDGTPRSIQVAQRIGDDFYEQANGAWVETIEVDGTGNAEPLITLSGGFAGYGFLLGSPAVNGAHAGGLMAILMTAPGIFNMGAGARVAFGAEDNGGAGYLITDIDIATNTATITPGLANPLVGGEIVVPVTPAQTLGGTPLGGVNAGFSLDGGATALGMISAKVTIGTGVVPLAAEATSAKPTGIQLAATREVLLEAVAYFEDENTEHVGGAHHPTQLTDVEVRWGDDVAGSRLRIPLPSLRLEVQPIDLPEGEVATVALNGRARQSAVAADEGSLIFD